MRREAALSIEMGAFLDDLSGTIHPHPTLSEALMESVEAALGQAVHIINKAEGGNKAAGTRVRKQMQKIKQASQLVRNRILEIRSAE